MLITDYRVQSVLRTYSRQLQRSRLVGKAESDESRGPLTEHVTISEEARRKMVMDRLAYQTREATSQQTSRETSESGMPQDEAPRAEES